MRSCYRRCRSWELSGPINKTTFHINILQQRLSRMLLELSAILASILKTSWHTCQLMTDMPRTLKPRCIFWNARMRTRTIMT